MLVPNLIVINYQNPHRGRMHLHMGGRASRCTGSGGKGHKDIRDRLRGATRFGVVRSRARGRRGESCTMSGGKGRGDRRDRLSISIFSFFLFHMGVSGGECLVSGRTRAPNVRALARPLFLLI